MRPPIFYVFILGLLFTFDFAIGENEASVWTILPSPDGTLSVTNKTSYGILDSTLVSTSQGSQLLFGGFRTIDDLVFDSSNNATENEISSELWQFTIFQGSDDVVWKRLKATGALPPPMAKHRAFWIPEKKEMIVFGGFYQINGTIVPATSDMYSYFLVDNKWFVNNNVSGLNTIYTIDNAVVHVTRENYLFQYGGHDHDDMGLSDDIAIFNISSRKWNLLEYNRSLPNPGPRQHHGMAYNFKSNKVYLYGGTNWTRFNPWGNPAEHLNDFWEFDLVTKKWKDLSPLFEALHLPAIGEFSMLSLGKSNQIVIFGGCLHKAMGRSSESTCAEVSNKLLIFTIENSTMSIANSTLELTRHSFASLFDINFFFGGLTDGGASNANLNNKMIMFGPKIMPFQDGETDENGVYVHPNARPKSKDWTNISRAIGGILTIVAFAGCGIAFFVIRKRKQKYAALRNVD